jgi:uncharacterized membrane protein
MYWILGLIGAMTGAAIGLSNNSSMLGGAMLGAMAFIALAAALRSRAAKTPDGGSATVDRAPAVEPLTVRVERLESQVRALSAEVATLREARFATPPLEHSAAVEAASKIAPVASGNTAAREGSEATIDPATLSQSAAPPAEQPTGSPQPPNATPAVPLVRKLEPSAAEASAPATRDAPRPDEQAASPTPETPPREPDWAERLFAAARNWLLGGNTVVRVGIIVLFFGVAFLLKYAADNSKLPVEFRLAGVALGATALLITGWRVGNRRGAYGLVLQGGGVGVLYLTTFAATKLYALLPAGAAFPLMVTICALSAFLAVRQNARSLAFMGSAGGFLAPVLLASGGGSHVVLFGYYALLNAGIFAIAWFKAWRPLNVLGFTCTFVIGTAWGVTAYRPALFSSTEPFLILFFMMYVGIALLYAVRREIVIRHYVDGTLVFGTPIVTLALQAALVKNMPFGLAWSAAALAAFYLGIAGWLSRYRDRLAILFESVLAIAVLFATLAIPLAFTGPTTSAAWAVEGAALTWLGVRQRHRVQFGFGLFMQLAAACAFAPTAGNSAAHLPILNGDYLATLLIAAAGVFTGWWLDGRDEARNWKSWMPQAGAIAAAWGLLWWIGGGAQEILVYARAHFATGDAHWSAVSARFTLSAFLLFAMFTAWLAHGLRASLGWALAEWPALAAVPALAGLVLCAAGMHEAPLVGLGRFAWPVAVAAAYALLRRQERDVDARLLAGLHIAMFWIVSILFALEGYWWLFARVPEGAWTWSTWAYVYGGLLLAVSTIGKRLAWPIGRYARAYQLGGAGPLVLLLWGWSLASLASDGDASPLFWLPLLNPLDVAQLLVALAVFAWVRRAEALGLQLDGYRTALQAVSGATAFLWLNTLLLRTIHHWTGVAYEFDALMHSTLVQASVSVFWTVCALAITVSATRRRSRALWLTGASLLGLTVVKLFMFDLSHVNGLARIVSFIGIGLMLLLIGYLSPLPPQGGAGEAEQEGVQ